MTPNQWIAATGIGTFVLVLIGVLGWTGPVGSWWRGRAFRGVPNIDMQPTSGASPDVRLVVTNRDRDGAFSATAQTVATRNDGGNPFRHGWFALKWSSAGTASVTLRREQSESLLVARCELFLSGPLARMGDVTLVECSGTTELRSDGFRWTVSPSERLPEYDIDVQITSTRRKKPLLRRYTLRPAKWSGPLELVERS